jgi:N utilization substance protein A
MEISDLVNTIEGLSEEQAVEIVARAETLAEEQAEEMPRRKGARPSAASSADAGAEILAGDGGDSRGRMPSPTLDELFGDEVSDSLAVATDLLTSDGGAGAVVEEDESVADAPSEEASPVEIDSDELDLTASAESDEIRDLALAAEGSEVEVVGREVTAPPSDADQDETARIVTEAVETGATSQEIEANPDGQRSQPLSSPKQTFSAEPAEGRDVEMNRP